MARTVVGLFKSHDEAQNVKHDLVNEGYTAEDIRVVGKDGQPLAQPLGAVGSTANKAADTGFGATISNFFKSFSGADPEDEKHYTEAVSTGGAFLAVTVPDNRADAAVSILEKHGAKNVDDQAPVSGKNATRVSGEKSLKKGSAGEKLNVVQEELQVGKRQVQRGGIRVYSHITERPVEEQVTLREEHVRVERHPINRAATEADFTAFQEGQIELKESAEEAVVSKKARVVEEVIIGKTTTERQETVKDTVRRTDVEVEQIAPTQSAQETGYSTFEPHFRQDFEKNYAKSGSSYDRYAPAYQYGHKLASDPKNLKGDWTSVESAAKSDWAKQGTGTWDDMKAAVRTGWEKVRSSSSAKT